MRRSDYDIIDTICTTNPAEVSKEILRLYSDLYQAEPSPQLVRAFEDMPVLYLGEHPEYHPCDTPYHDIQHVMDVTLTMARLLVGYERGRNGGAPLPAEFFALGIVVALFHDFGYLRRRGDHKHRFGAEYTLTHVSRGSHFLLDYLPAIGWQRYAGVASQLIHFTGYERDVTTIRIDDPLLRRVGEILGTADIIAQMSDRCYLEKCRHRLYPEFVLGGLTHRKEPDGTTVILFESGADLVRKTPAFYANALIRLNEKLNRAYVYAESFFSGQNLYLEEMDKNARYAQVAGADERGDSLRRMPPNTLPPRVRAIQQDLVIR